MSRVGEEFIEGVLSVDISFERALYTDAQMDWPMTLTRTTHRIGTSSITHKSIICRENAVLSSAFVTCVLIDSKTGKSAPLPPVFYDRFKPQTNGQRLDSLPAYPLPPSGQYYRSIAKVSHSDIDFNQHLNASVYVRYCMDCAIDASNAGFLKYAFQNQETYLRKVANVKLLYLAESVPGDQLSVCVWNHPNDKDVVKFLIQNTEKQSSPICRCVLRFQKNIRSKEQKYMRMIVLYLSIYLREVDV